MKRFAICKFGEFENPGFSDPKVNAYASSVRTIAQNPNFGEWGVVQFATGNITGAAADPDVILWPDITLDAQWGPSLPFSVRDAVHDALATAGFEVAGLFTTNTSKGNLTYIAAQIEPGVQVDAGDVYDANGST